MKQLYFLIFILISLLLHACYCPDFDYDYNKNAVYSPGKYRITRMSIEEYINNRLQKIYSFKPIAKRNAYYIIYLENENPGYIVYTYDKNIHKYIETNFKFKPNRKYQISLPSGDCATPDIFLYTDSNGKVKNCIEKICIDDTIVIKDAIIVEFTEKGRKKQKFNKVLISKENLNTNYLYIRTYDQLFKRKGIYLFASDAIIQNMIASEFDFSEFPLKKYLLTIDERIKLNKKITDYISIYDITSKPDKFLVVLVDINYYNSIIPNEYIPIKNIEYFKLVFPLYLISSI